MRARGDRTGACLCHVSEVGTCQGCTSATAVLVILLIWRTIYFSYSKYCRELQYLRSELRGCNTVKFSKNVDPCILALGLTAFAVVVLLLETPCRLRRA